MFIEILFKILLSKGGVLIYAEHYIYIYIYIYIYKHTHILSWCMRRDEARTQVQEEVFIFVLIIK